METDNNDKENIKKIFMTCTDEMEEEFDMSGRITATSILDTIPTEATATQLGGWTDTKQTEWRWRFLEFDNKNSVEISYIKANNDIRYYHNRYGNWVTDDVSKEYDKHVVKIFYYYT
jgi:hypothetical protein